MKLPKPEKRRPASSVEAVASAQELKPGQTRKETEGVFVIRDGKAEFVPIKIGIAGDKYFEIRGGLAAGDQVITGPYNSVRNMADGDAPTLAEVQTALEELRGLVQQVRLQLFGWAEPEGQ